MLENIIIYLIIGSVAGLIAGTLGIGSGVFVVPALAFVFTREHFFSSTVMQVAAGTSLASITVTTSRALISHLKRKVPIWPVYKHIFPGVIVGTLIGAILADFLHSSTLGILFGIIIFLLGLKMMFPSKKIETRKLPNNFTFSSVGFLIGAKSGLLGLGGGAFSTPFFTHLGISIRQSFAIATAISLTVSMIGTIIFILAGLHAQHLPSWSTGYVYWPAWIGIIVGSLLFVPLGVWLSNRLPVLILQRFFAIFLMIIGLQMLYVIST